LDLDVDPTTSELYFSDRSDNSIYRIDQFGNNLTLIAAVSGFPGAICLDLVNEKLYWVETDNGHISQSDYNGANRTVVHTFSGNLLGGLDIGVIDATAIEENKNAISFNLYPNPATDMITVDVESIQNTSGINNMVIFDLIGKEVLHETITIISDKLTVDVSDLPNGNYFVRLGQFGNTQKLIINK
jgi:hypothetical protein